MLYDKFSSQVHVSHELECSSLQQLHLAPMYTAGLVGLAYSSFGRVSGGGGREECADTLTWSAAAHVLGGRKSVMQFPPHSVIWACTYSRRDDVCHLTGSISGGQIEGITFSIGSGEQIHIT